MQIVAFSRFAMAYNDASFCNIGAGPTPRTSEPGSGLTAGLGTEALRVERITNVIPWVMVILLSVLFLVPGAGWSVTAESTDSVALLPAGLSPEDLNHLGVRYALGEGVEQNFEMARVCWKQAASSDHPGAQYNLGQMYETASGVERDLAEAAGWYGRAALGGDRLAQFRLGLLLEAGNGIERDEATAARLFRQAAEQGLAAAQNSLGRAYEMGRGVDQDIETAKDWYRLAALQGDVFAQSNLGFQIYAGRKSAGEIAEAYAWIRLAAEQNNAIAKAHLLEVSGKMTPRQREEGARLFRQLKAKIDARKSSAGALRPEPPENR